MIKMRLRLSQSVQKTLQVGKDLMFLLVEKGPEPSMKKQVKAAAKGEDSPEGSWVVQYSSQLMCDDTGISYEEPSPNAFSFNSPYGACPTCKGLGTVYQVSMDAVIPDPTKCINEGGIAPLGEEREAMGIQTGAAACQKNIRSIWINPLKNFRKKHSIYYCMATRIRVQMEASKWI